MFERLSMVSGPAAAPGSDADVKFVMEASAQNRAQRRFEDLRSVGEEVTLADVLAHVKQRDAVDAIQWEPLLLPGAAIRVDTTTLTITQVVDRLEAHVRRRLGASPKQQTQP